MVNDGTQDLLDLCRLNQLEEHIKGSPALDAKATLTAIDIRRRQVAMRLINNPPAVPAGATEPQPVTAKG